MLLREDTFTEFMLHTWINQDKYRGASRICALFLNFLFGVFLLVFTLNVEQDKIYKELNGIECSVTDNLSDNVEYEIYLNEKIYSGEKLNEGKYNLLVTAKDESGNESRFECNFIVPSCNGKLQLAGFILKPYSI